MGLVEEERKELLGGRVEEQALEMVGQGGNDVLERSGSGRKVHSDDHLAVQIPDTAHQISNGFFSFNVPCLPFREPFSLVLFVFCLWNCLVVFVLFFEVGWIRFCCFLLDGIAFISFVQRCFLGVFKHVFT